MKPISTDLEIILQPVQLREDEFLDEESKLVYCSKCGTPRQKRLEVLGKIYEPRCRCACQQAANEQQELERKQREFLDVVSRNRSVGLPDPELKRHTFENDLGYNREQMRKAKQFVANWDAFRSKAMGLLFWGYVGTGKSYIAGCIANALLDKGVPVMMTNFARLLNKLTDMYSGDRNAYIDSFNAYPLLIIDDLGIERNSEFAREQVFHIIDSRYRSQLPMIVTTNLTLKELKDPEDLARARIYDRVLERCVPILVNDQNVRKLIAAQNIGTEARIDHRSHADRGILEQPTIHEGVTARAMEQQGFIADRCELNRQIRADNKLLRELRSAFEKIAKAVKHTVPAIAEAMETLRRNMLIFRYQILHTKANRRSMKNTLADVMPVLRQYSDLVGQIKTLSRERKGLLDEKKATSVLNILKQRELAKRIAQLSEDIEELRSEKAMILSRFDKSDDDGMKEVKKWVASMESSLQRLEQTEAKYQAELDAALTQFRELVGEAESMDKTELQNQRQILRMPHTQDARDKLQQTHGKQYSAITMMEAQQDVDHLLREDERKLEPPVQKRPDRHQPEPRKKPPKRDYER